MILVDGEGKDFQWLQANLQNYRKSLPYVLHCRHAGGVDRPLIEVEEDRHQRFQRQPAPSITAWARQSFAFNLLPHHSATAGRLFQQFRIDVP